MRGLDDRLASLKSSDAQRRQEAEDQERSLRPYSYDLYKRLVKSVDGTSGWGKFDFYDHKFNPGQRIVTVVRRTQSRRGVFRAEFKRGDGEVLVRTRDWGEFVPYTDGLKEEMLDSFLDSAAEELRQHP